MKPAGGWQAVLFDLDGTLVDSAPDLAGTANSLRADRGLPALPLAVLREHCGSGARGMLGAGLSVRPGDADYAPLRAEFLARYERRLLESSQPFEGVRSVLQRLSEHGIPWAIVTNKSAHLAQPLMRTLGWQPGAWVAGDTTPHTKPHPAPLLEAARRLAVDPRACVYVGDDLRDMQAARAATMAGWAAAWGYTGGSGLPVEAWGAELVLPAPPAVLQCLNLA